MSNHGRGVSIHPKRLAYLQKIERCVGAFLNLLDAKSTADEFLVLANTAVDPQERDAYLQLANVYNDLVDAYEEGDTGANGSEGALH